jgi:chromosome segregation ATPase
MNDCIESLKKYLHEVVLQNQASVLSHRQGAINDEDIESCPSSSSDVAFMESSVIICDHKSTMSDIISSFQSMQSIITNIQESHLVAMTHAEITTKEKVNALNEQVVALQAENRKLVESNRRITSEMEERSAEHDHMQLQIDQSTEFLSELRMQLASKTSALDTELMEQNKEREIVASLESDKQKSLLVSSYLREQLKKEKESVIQLQDRVKLLEVDRVLLCANKQELTTQLHATISTIKFLKQSLKDEESSSENLREQLDKTKHLLSESVALESQRLDEICNLQQSTADVIDKLKSKQNSETKKLNRKIELLHKELGDYKIGLSTVYEKVKLQSADLAELRTQLAAQNDEIGSLRLQNSEASLFISDCQSRLKTLCASVCGASCPSNLTFDEMFELLHNETSKSRDENAILEHQVFILSKEVSKCKRENTELSKASTSLKA